MESSAQYSSNSIKNDAYNTSQIDKGGYLSPLEYFTYGLQSKDAKRQYPSLLNRFLCFLNLEGDLEQKCRKLLILAKNDPNLFQSNLIRYCNETKKRIERGEISEGTISSYSFMKK